MLKKVDSISSQTIWNHIFGTFSSFLTSSKIRQLPGYNTSLMSGDGGGEGLGRQGKGEASSPPYPVQNHNVRLLNSQEFHQRMRSQRQGAQEELMSTLSQEVNCTYVFFKAAGEGRGGQRLIDHDSAKQ